MEKLIEIADRAAADYGFRQIVQWSPDDIVGEWSLSDREADVLKGPLKDALDELPIPVEPADLPREQERLAQIIRDGLS